MKNELTNTNKTEPTIRQVKFIETVVNSSVGDTDLKLIEKIGICHVTFYKWRKMFAAEIDKRVREKLHRSKPRLFDALVKKALDGDTQALKLALEMTREYIPFSRAEIEKKGEVNIKVNLKEALRGNLIAKKKAEDAENTDISDTG